MTAPGAGVVVVRAVGEIDLLTAPAWRRMLASGAQVLTSTPPAPRTEASVRPADRLVPRLVCDLSPVTFLGATGLTVLVELADQCTRTGVDLRVVAGNRRVSRLLAHTALDRHLTTTSRLDQAVVAGRRSTGTPS